MINEEIGSPRGRETCGSNIRIEFQEDTSAGGLRLYVFGMQGSKFVAADSISFREYGMYDMIPSALVINRTEAQGLMESLWKAGVRPKSGEGSSGQLAATERHLNDMRSLVSHYSKAGLGK